MIRRFRLIFSVVSITVLLALVFAVGCGSNSPSTTTSGVGSATVTLSDPPSCSDLQHVYVTIDDVSATTSSADSGWQDLASQLSSSSGGIKAMQVDLMNLPQNGQCLLAQLGSTQSLPVGNYGQIRLMLVPNDATGVTLLPGSVVFDNVPFSPTTSVCQTAFNVNAWNCVVAADGTASKLDLSSQAQTGLKIPPGQVLGGPIQVGAGQSVDINLDFNACRSVVAQGTGQFRLDPVLVAYQVSQNLSGISGQVVQGNIVSNAVSVTTTPVANANVALELAKIPNDGSNSVDTISNWLTTADTSGNFAFCPLPMGPNNTPMNFDLVTNAGASGTTTGDYNATIVTGVPNGTKVTVPVLAETGGPATLSGNVTATSTAASITANLFALQPATTTLEFAVPLLTGSNPAISQITVPCTGGNCTAPFSLVVPSSNPLVGAFSSGNISWTVPSTTAPVNYKVGATCNTGTVATFSTASAVTAGTTTTLGAGQPPQLAGCQ